MPSVRDLFQSLQGSGGTLNTQMMTENVQRLRDIRQCCADDDAQQGPPACKVRVVGDPEIFDSKGRYFHYYGPALLVNLDNRGMVRSLEFVGVRPDNDYISEVWHLDVKTNAYKYRNLTNMQGVSSYSAAYDDYAAEDDKNEPQFRSGQASWNSEAAEGATPPATFLNKFKPESHTFFVDCRSGNFCLGPPYGMLQKALENPKRIAKSLFKSCSVGPDVWMQNAADMISRNRDEVGKFVAPSREMQAVQLALLVYGLATGIAA
eukprot:TRINITY_DN22339_c0_g2_i1.p1 TRINITY_DN22339_c0_g2~~TRINITY_DN22339_c0_g2_i1.p1  ORF type:complete len:263 (+),score=25.21 TRINITY_DN22339_c0_g2_i1:118-906(+)